MGTADATTFINDLRQELLRPLPEPAFSMLRASRRLVSAEMYSGPMRALWELVQNADDCTYAGDANLRLVQTSQYIWLQYNEKGLPADPKIWKSIKI